MLFRRTHHLSCRERYVSGNVMFRQASAQRSMDQISAFGNGYFIVNALTFVMESMNQWVHWFIISKKSFECYELLVIYR